MQISISKTKIITGIILTALILPLLFVPVVASAELFPTLVPCDGPVGDGVTGEPCTYSTFIKGVDNILRFLIGFATVVAVIMFVYAGYLLISSGGDRAKAEQAKAIFKNVTIGFVIVITAWLIVFTIVDTFTGNKPLPQPLRDLGLIELIQKEYV